MGGGGGEKRRWAGGELITWSMFLADLEGGGGGE